MAFSHRETNQETVILTVVRWLLGKERYGKPELQSTSQGLLDVDGEAFENSEIALSDETTGMQWLVNIRGYYFRPPFPSALEQCAFGPFQEYLLMVLLT